MATILVIDDRPANRDLLTTLLGYAGHRVLEATNGVNALDKVRTDRPDLIITDLLMPEMDGFEFVRKLRADPEHMNTPVIFCTATYLEPAARALAAACGPHQFVTKPFEPAALLAIVDSALTPDVTVQQTSQSRPAQSTFKDMHLRLLQDKLISELGRLESINANLEERVRDRTLELEAANEKLQHQIEQVELTNCELERTRNEQIRLRDQFLSHVSHELRSPLTAVHQFATILFDGLAGPIVPEQKEYLQIILGNVNQLRVMIDDLLEGTRAQTGKLVVQPCKTSLTEAIMDTMNMFRELSATKSIHLLHEVPHGFPPVLADPARLRQVLINLVDNALKFTPPGGTITVQVKILDETDRSACASVSDTGCGILVDDQPQIFERLYQAPKTTSEARSGLGLGLYICKELITRQGGEIWLDTSSSNGTKVCFTLPIFSIARMIETLFTVATRPVTSVALYEIEIFSEPGCSSSRIRESTLGEARRVPEHCLLPDLDVLVPTVHHTESGELFFVVASVDQNGAEVLLKRLREQLAGAVSLKEAGVAHRIHHEVLELEKEAISGKNQIDLVSTWIVQQMDSAITERSGVNL